MHMMNLSHSSWGDCVLAELNLMRLNGATCDVKICLTDDMVILAHSCVLSAVSPFFKTILHGAESPEMDFRDFPSRIIKQVVQFIYTGEVMISKAEVSMLHSVATNLSIQSLVDMVQQLVDLPHQNTFIEVDSEDETASVPSDPKLSDIPRLPAKCSTHKSVSSKKGSPRLGSSLVGLVPKKESSQFFQSQDGESEQLDLGEVQMKKEEQHVFPAGLAIEITDKEEVNALNLMLHSQGISTNHDDDPKDAGDLDNFDKTESLDVMHTDEMDNTSQDGQASANLENGLSLDNYCTQCAIAYTSELRYHRHMHHKHGTTLPIDVYLMSMNKSKKKPRTKVDLEKQDSEEVISGINLEPSRTGKDPDPTSPNSNSENRSPVRRSGRQQKKNVLNVEGSDLENDNVSKKKQTKGKKQNRVSKEKYDKTVVCSKCQRKFLSVSSLRVHESVHKDEKLYSCSKCGKFFKQIGNMRVHERKHDGEKPFVCSTCGRGFAQAAHLKSHIRTHTGEKPHQCTFCGRSFGTLTNLQSHIRRHTGEKPYKCTTCGQAFSQLGNLNTHRRRHTGIKPFICSHCDKSFTTLCNLQRHFQRLHMNNRPVHCPDCNKGFVNKSEMRAHQRNKHMRVAVPGGFKIKRTNTMHDVEITVDQSSDIMHTDIAIVDQEQSYSPTPLAS